MTYHVGDANLRHEDLTRAIAATQQVQEPAEYPGFSDQPIDGFRHLRAHLARFGRVFTQARQRSSGSWSRGFGSIRDPPDSQRFGDTAV